MPEPVLTALQTAVRTRGMRPFLLHETIGKQVFSKGFSSGSGPLAVWEGPLTNLDDGEFHLVAWFMWFVLL